MCTVNCLDLNTLLIILVLGWWMWPSDSSCWHRIVDRVQNQGATFITLPYTGTKTSAEFYNDDYGNELFGTNYPIKGYAPACAVSTGVENIISSDLPVSSL